MSDETVTIKVDRPFRVFIGEGWDDADPRVEVYVSKNDINNNTPEQLEVLLGCRLLAALLDLGVAHRANIVPVACVAEDQQ